MSKLRKATVDFSETIAANKLGSKWDPDQAVLGNIEAIVDELLERWIEAEVLEKQGSINNKRSKVYSFDSTDKKKSLKKRYNMDISEEEGDNTFARDMDGQEEYDDEYDDDF